MKAIPSTAPEHWRGLLHILPHCQAMLIRDATGARFPLTPADCQRQSSNNGKVQKAIRLRLWRRDQHYGFVRCHWCGNALTREQVTKDHIRARCFGGSDRLTNIGPSCGAIIAGASNRHASWKACAWSGLSPSCGLRPDSSPSLTNAPLWCLCCRKRLPRTKSPRRGVSFISELQARKRRRPSGIVGVDRPE
jgi:hypothetical protein